MADPALRILVCATQAAPTRLAELLAAQFGAAAVMQLQTVRLQATADCAGLAQTLSHPRAEPLPEGQGVRVVSPAWVVLTSPGGIGVVWQELRARGMTQAQLQILRYAVVGDATAEALRAEGLEPAYISGHGGGGASVDSGRAKLRGGSGGGGGGARALAEGLAASGLTAGATVHVLQSNRADSSVWTPLQAKAAALKRWVAYRSDLMPEDTGPVAAAFRAGQFTAVAFTSGSTVEGLYAVAGADKAAATTKILQAMKVFSIGPTATQALQAAGVLQVLDAPEATVPALAEAMRKKLQA